MTDTTQDRWDACDSGTGSFQVLSEIERELLAAHVPAPEDGIALDVGCGPGELARHLATTGYRVDAVDCASAAIGSATADSGAAQMPLWFGQFDIERDNFDALPHQAYDLVIFRLSYAFLSDRSRVMNLVRDRLRPGGAVCVITPVADAVPGDRRDVALDEDEISLLCAGWSDAVRHDADGLAFLVLRGPRTAPVAYRNMARPSPHALTGAGVVVTDAVGRVLLGWSVRGMWTLPGGKNEAGEAFVRTAVRELEEETGLTASPEDARLVAFLMDAVDDIPRMTAAVRISAHSGEPTVTEPELIRRWEWHEPSALPSLGQALFTPSAHVLETIWPGLLPDLPPVHRHVLVPDRRAESPELEQRARHLLHALVDRLRHNGRITGADVEAAFRRVPRHRFAPEASLHDAYADDTVVVTKRKPDGSAVSSVSAAWLQAHMLRDAALRPGDRAVEIGSGGCNAALMQEVVGPHGSVISVDIDPFVTDRATRFLADTGYDRVRVHLGDGRQAPAGLADGSVDAIVVTVEARDIPSAWVDLLTEGGRLVVPLRVHGYTWSIPFEKRDGALVGHAFDVCGFVPMQGPGYREDTTVLLRGGEVTLRFSDGSAADTFGLDHALTTHRIERWTGVTVAGNTPFDMLLLWLATTLDGFCRLSVDPDLDTGVVAAPANWDAAACVQDGSLARLHTRKVAHDPETGVSTWEFGIHAYGPNASRLADVMAERIVAWDRDHRRHAPTITVRPASSPGRPAAGVRTVLKSHARLEFRWASADAVRRDRPLAPGPVAQGRHPDVGTGQRPPSTASSLAPGDDVQA